MHICDISVSAFPLHMTCFERGCLWFLHILIQNSHHAKPYCTTSSLKVTQNHTAQCNIVALFYVDGPRVRSLLNLFGKHINLIKSPDYHPRVAFRSGNTRIGITSLQQLYDNYTFAAASRMLATFALNFRSKRNSKIFRDDREQGLPGRYYSLKRV